MTHHPETVGSGDSVEQAAVLMLHGGFRHLPVVEGDDVLGIVSMRDLVRDTLSDHAPRGA
jgi:CBS domain-containing protein